MKSIQLCNRKGVVLNTWHSRSLIGSATLAGVFLVTLLIRASSGLDLVLSWFAMAGLLAAAILYSIGFWRVGEGDGLAQEVEAINQLDQYQALVDLHKSVAETLVFAIDAKEQNQGHVIRVQRYAEKLAEAMCFPQAELEGIAAAALLHDIGKLAVPDHLLKKQGALTAEEMARMRLHPEVGADIIKNVRFPYPVVDAVRYHHERYDGSGYPLGLRGEDIPVAARVLAVVDSYESFIFRNGDQDGATDAAMAMLDQEAGTLFDPEIVAIWRTVHRQAYELDWIDPSNEIQGAYSYIKRANLEGDWLATLSDAVSGLTSVAEIGREASQTLEANISPSTAFLWSVQGNQVVGCIDESEGTRGEPAVPGVEVPGWVAGQQTPSVNVDVGEGPFSGCRVVAVPVVFEGKTVALLSVYRGASPFSDDEIRLVTATAERIRGSVYRAQVLATIRQESVSDRLTGLANRRLLDSEFGQMDQSAFSVIVFDIDEFKAVNDQFGHRAGDELLVSVAQHMRTAFPGANVICRFGGDEFVVLGQFSYFEAHKLARRFGQFVGADPDLKPYREVGCRVSFGIASAPTDGSTLEGVIGEADQRMYVSKARFKKARFDQASREAAAESSPGHGSNGNALSP